jgi:hypothetical protein
MEMVEMLPLYEDRRFTFQFADHRIISRIHLEGVGHGREENSTLGSGQNSDIGGPDGVRRRRGGVGQYRELNHPVRFDRGVLPGSALENPTKAYATAPTTATCDTTTTQNTMRNGTFVVLWRNCR